MKTFTEPTVLTGLAARCQITYKYFEPGKNETS